MIVYITDKMPPFVFTVVSVEHPKELKAFVFQNPLWDCPVKHLLKRRRRHNYPLTQIAHMLMITYPTLSNI